MRVVHRGPAESGVLVYAAGPEFYSLGAQYGYQTLALSFSVAAVYLLFVSIDAAATERGRLFALALVSIAAMVVSHHVTAWLTVAFLVAWAVGLRVTNGSSSPAGPSESGPGARLDRVPPQAGIDLRGGNGVGTGAVPDRRARCSLRLVLAGAWIAVVGHMLTSYVGPLIQEGFDSALEMVGQFHGNRKRCSRTRREAAPLAGSQLSYRPQPVCSA